MSPVTIPDLPASIDQAWLFPGQGAQTIGIRRGWRGLIEGDFVALIPRMTAGDPGQGRNNSRQFPEEPPQGCRFAGQAARELEGRRAGRSDRGGRG